MADTLPRTISTRSIESSMMCSRLTVPVVSCLVSGTPSIITSTCVAALPRRNRLVALPRPPFWIDWKPASPASKEARSTACERSIASRPITVVWGKASVTSCSVRLAVTTVSRNCAGGAAVWD